MRDWVFIATMNKEGDLLKLDPFIPEKLNLSSPVDMAFGPDGALYVLEYGTRWFAGNPDARLTRIDYAAGNRAPLARIDMDATVGAAPMTVALSASRSMDYDAEDVLSYSWDFGNGETGSGETVEATFAEPGIYQIRLVVSDQEGNEGRSTRELRVGNAPPQIDVQLSGNQSFFWEGMALPYRIDVTDAEDGSLSAGSIASSAVSITFDYLEASSDPTEDEQGHAAVANASMLAAGQELITASGCIACHGFEEHIVGPAYTEVAKKYENRDDAVSYLVGKIINGGIGIWGGKAMPAQQQIEPADARKMAMYIMSLNQATPGKASLPATGTLRTDQHRGAGEGSTYTLRVSYTDQGGEPVGPLNAHQSVILRSPRIRGDEADMAQTENASVYETNGMSILVFMGDGHAGFGEMDLTGISRLDLRYRGTGGGTLEVRLDAPDGPLLASHRIEAGTGEIPAPQSATLDLKEQAGFHTLYLVSKKTGDGDAPRGLFAVEWFYLDGK
ncbi:MAG: PKD domain-containing protein [Bacteroidetes bacterium]|nr:MAG: PKD domain-containing protein [Bacteroidota bacterium]